MALRSIPTVAIHVVRGVFVEAVEHGQDLNELCERFKVPQEQLIDADARVGADVMRRIWNELPPLVGVENFGLAVARRAQESGALGVVGYVLRSAPTVGQGLQAVMRFQRLITDAVTSSWKVSGDEVRVVFEDRDPTFRIPRHAIEFGLASVLLLLRATTAKKLTPRWVAFRHGRSADDTELRNTFSCSLSYGAPDNVIAFARADLDVRQHSADPHLSALLERHASLLEGRLPSGSTFVARVRHALRDTMPRGDTGLDAVAEKLGLSRRTLQRRLGAEKTTHQRVLDDLRHELAVQYFDESELDIQEVAFLLGFSDQSAFHRAFVRWTGLPPGAYRKRAK